MGLPDFVLHFVNGSKQAHSTLQRALRISRNRSPHVSLESMPKFKDCCIYLHLFFFLHVHASMMQYSEGSTCTSSDVVCCNVKLFSNQQLNNIWHLDFTGLKMEILTIILHMGIMAFRPKDPTDLEQEKL